MVPGEHVWVDVVLPAGDPLADDDVERATWWLGHAWARALRLELVAEGAGGLSADASAVPVGTPASGQAASGQAASGPAVLHQRGVSDRVAGRVACFAALGPGELSVDGRKVLGISQRRTRFGFCSCFAVAVDKRGAAAMPHKVCRCSKSRDIFWREKRI